MSKHTRREFLEQSLFAAAAAATAGVAGTRALAAPEASSSPNEKLGIAVLGVRGRGQQHIGEFKRRADCEIVAIVDPDEAIGNTAVEKLASETGRRPVFYKDVRKALEDTHIDAVTIATPNHWHALGAIWAIQHGKDVYCEKPVSHNVSEGRRIVEAARKHNRIVQTGTQCRSNPANIEAIAFVRSGGIGTVKLARGLCYKRRGSIGPKGKYEVPASVNYDLWCGPAPIEELTRPKLHYDWHWAWSTGNGDLGNQGIHQMDICRWGLGVDDLGVSALSYGGRLGYSDAGETANTQVSVHEFGGKTLVFEVRGLETDKYRGADVGVVFHGSDGYVVMTSYTRGAAFDRDGTMIKTFTGGEDRLHYDNFVQAVRDRKVETLTADILEGHLSSALCHLGNISYRLGEELPVKEAAARLPQTDENLETFERVTAHLKANGVELDSTRIRMGRHLAFDSTREVFVGADAKQANPLLSREYRKGFEVPESV